MILISFAFLGDKVKIRNEGRHPMQRDIMNPESKLREIYFMRDTILEKDSKKFKDIYTWCKGNCSGKIKKGKCTSFYF